MSANWYLVAAMPRWELLGDNLPASCKRWAGRHPFTGGLFALSGSMY
jgi:hypothetical protein